MVTWDGTNRSRRGAFLKRIAAAAAIALAIFAVGAGSVLVVTGAIATGRSAPAVAKLGSQTLPIQESRLVEQRSAAIAAYAANFAEFKRVRARPPGAVGINLNAAEERRRDNALTGLVLECINAVDRYNLAAQALSATQLQSAGLPEQFAWGVDCAPER